VPSSRSNLCSGYSGEGAREKANTMRSCWVPGMKNLGRFGRGAFAEFTAGHEIEKKFGELVETLVADKAARGEPRDASDGF
jgi:type III restriction enzyme